MYILRSLKNDTFYIGSTNDIDRRIIQHNTGKSIYTSEVMPFEIVFKQSFPTLKEARKAEYWLKRQKDKNLINKLIIEGKINKSFV